MNEMSTRAAGLVNWALAGFHTTIFVLTLVLLVYDGGSLGRLLGDSVGAAGTLIGLAVFAVLWFATWFGTSRALRGVLPRRLGVVEFLSTMWKGAIGGAFTGVFLLACLLLVLIPLVVVSAVAQAGLPRDVVIGGAVAAFALSVCLAINMIRFAVANTIAQANLPVGVKFAVLIILLLTFPASVFAAAIGALVGILAAILDWLLLWAASSILGPMHEAPARADESLL